MNLIAKTTDAIRGGRLTFSVIVAWDHHGPAAWETCEDACDMLCLLAYVDRKAAVKAACACARTALQYLPPGEDRPLRAIETAEAWTRGEATEDQCREAASAARATRAARAADAAWAAADAAAYAARAAYAAANAATAAAYAATAAASSAADRAAYGSQEWQQVYDQTLRDLTDVVRANAACPTPTQLLSYAK